MKTMQKLFARVFPAIGILALLSTAAFVSKADAQTQVGTSPLQQAVGVPWQVGGSWTFTSASTPTSAFNLKSIGYYLVLFTPSAGFAGTCAVSIDSAAAVDSNGVLVSPSTGGVLPSGTIGSCAAAGRFLTPAAIAPTNFGQLTPTITGAGSVTVTLLGYTNNPATSGGSISGTVAVSSLPPTPAGSNNIGSVNLANVTAVTGPSNVTSTQAVAVTVGGASEIQITVTGTWTGTLQPAVSGDGTNYINALVHPDYPLGPWQSTITANGTYAANVAAGNSFEVVGNTVASGTAVVTVTASPGVEDVVVTGLNTPADAASTPIDALHDQSWPMGWNGATSDRLRTAGVGNTVAPTGILASAAYCEFLTALPTLTTGTYGAAECDAKAQIFVDVNYVLGALHSKTNPLFSALTDGTNVIAAAMSAYGTAPTGTMVMGVNTFVTNTVAVQPSPSTLAGQANANSSQSALTTAVVVKASNGNLYGFQVTNGAASVCYLQFINASAAPVLGTAAVFSFAVPASGSLTLPPGAIALSHLTTGISVGMSTTYNGSTACGTAATAVIFYN